MSKGYMPKRKSLSEIKKKKKDAASGDSSDTSTASKTSTKTSTVANPHTQTSTDAYTQGNITVTGGAGKGATIVHIAAPRGMAPETKTAKPK